MTAPCFEPHFGLFRPWYACLCAALALAASLGTIAAAVDESAIGTVIHVAMDGNDGNNGNNGLSATSAVASPAQGIALALPYLHDGTPVKVLIHPGTYHLQEPLRVIGWDIGGASIETPFVLAGVRHRNRGMLTTMHSATQ